MNEGNYSNHRCKVYDRLKNIRQCQSLWFVARLDLVLLRLVDPHGYEHLTAVTRRRTDDGAHSVAFVGL